MSNLTVSSIPSEYNIMYGIRRSAMFTTLKYLQFSYFVFLTQVYFVLHVSCLFLLSLLARLEWSTLHYFCLKLETDNDHKWKKVATVVTNHPQPRQIWADNRTLLQCLFPHSRSGVRSSKNLRCVMRYKHRIREKALDIVTALVKRILFLRIEINEWFFCFLLQFFPMTRNLRSVKARNLRSVKARNLWSAQF